MFDQANGKTKKKITIKFKKSVMKTKIKFSNHVQSSLYYKNKDYSSTKKDVK